MWLGFVVLVAFFGACLLGIYVGVRAVIDRKWPTAIIIGLPALLIAIFLGSWAGPGVYRYLIENPDLPDVSQGAEPVAGADLERLLTGKTVEGKIYRDRTWINYTATFTADGEFEAEGGPDDNPDQDDWDGDWKVEDDRLCRENDSGDMVCEQVFAYRGGYEVADRNDEVYNTFTIVEPEPEPAEGDASSEGAG